MKPMLWPTWYRVPFHAAPATDVLAYVARQFRISPEDVRSKSRRKYLVDARVVVAKIMRDRSMSYPTIAKFLGRKDHASIINLVGNFEQRARHNPVIAEVYAAANCLRAVI